MQAHVAHRLSEASQYAHTTSHVHHAHTHARDVHTCELPLNVCSENSLLRSVMTVFSRQTREIDLNYSIRASALGRVSHSSAAGHNALQSNCNRCAPRRFISVKSFLDGPSARLEADLTYWPQYNLILAALENHNSPVKRFKSHCRDEPLITHARAGVESTKCLTPTCAGSKPSTVMIAKTAARSSYATMFVRLSCKSFLTRKGNLPAT